MNKIGIVGQGFVGNSIKEGMIKDYPNLLTYDLNPELSMCDSIEELVNNSDIIFVCVPTPMKKDGSCHVGIVDSVLEQIAKIVYPKFVETNEKEIQKIAVLKTTIPPGTSKAFNDVYSKMGIEIVFNPEFLTEANAVNDFKNQNRIVLGGSSEAALNSVAGLYRKSFPTVPIVHMTHDEAEMVKYVTNTFLASKVIFANEMYQICTSLDINYDNVVNAAKLDTRLGQSHWKVPGPDGDFGFGGHCFPKDTNAIKYLANKNGVKTTLLDSVLDKNNSIRKNKDWEEQEGRAVINE